MPADDATQGRLPDATPGGQREPAHPVAGAGAAPGDLVAAAGDSPVGGQGMGGGVAGVRGEDGALAWVRGVPPAIDVGAVVRYARAGVEASGRVAIAPALVAWCDPSVPCWTFLDAPVPSLQATPDLPAVPALHGEPDAQGVPDLFAGSPSEPQPATLLAPAGAPDPATLASRVALARAELHRLDDPGISLIRSGPPRGR